MEEQTWRVPLLVSWSAEETVSDGSYAVAEKAQAVLEEFQERQENIVGNGKQPQGSVRCLDLSRSLVCLCTWQGRSSCYAAVAWSTFPIPTLCTFEGLQMMHSRPCLTQLVGIHSGSGPPV